MCVLVLGCGEDVFAGLQVLRVTSGQQVTLHSSQCFSLDGASGSGSAATPNQAVNGPADFWFRQEDNDEGIRFKFGSGAATREDKVYRDVFFASSKLDRFVVLSQMEDHYVVAVWGSSECNTCPPDTGESESDPVCGTAEALEAIAQLDN